MTAADRQRLLQLRPTLTGLMGFYALMYEGDDQTPERRMICEAHFATDALHVAKELLSIINADLDRLAPDE